MWVIPCGPDGGPSSAVTPAARPTARSGRLHPCPRGQHATAVVHGRARRHGLGVVEERMVDTGSAISDRRAGSYSTDTPGATDIATTGHTGACSSPTPATSAWDGGTRDIYRFEDGGWEFSPSSPDLDNGALVDVGRDGTVWPATTTVSTRFAEASRNTGPRRRLGAELRLPLLRRPGVDYVGETQFDAAARTVSLW